jgi:hypothetical protein
MGYDCPGKSSRNPVLMLKEGKYIGVVTETPQVVVYRADTLCSTSSGSVEMEGTSACACLARCKNGGRYVWKHLVFSPAQRVNNPNDFYAKEFFWMGRS